MLQKEYLADKSVLDFTEWFGAILASSAPRHSYLMPGARSVLFRGLADALREYHWRFNFDDPDTGIAQTGHSFADSDAALTKLATGLDLAINSSSTLDSKAADWSIAVMKWGGVSYGNAKWLKARQVGLAGC